MVNVSWLINGTEVQTTESVTEASYTNISAAVGTWNVSAVVTNENGTVSRTWIWNVSLQATSTPTPTPCPTPSPPPLTTPTPSPTHPPIQILSSDIPSAPFFIYGFVYDESGEGCHGPVVNITNTNTSKQWEAETNESYNYYQLILYTTNISAGDVLQINASENGTLIGSVNHTITQDELNRGIIRVDISKKLPDLIVSNISTPPYALKDEEIAINVTVCNNGTASSGPFIINLSVNGLTDEKQVPGLEADSCTDINFSWTPTAIGNYTITALADSKHEIYELNESNNSMSKRILVSSPDLAVTKIEIETGCGSFKHPCYRYLGYVLNVNATIENFGTANASDFVVKFYDEFQEKVSLFNKTNVSHLPAGSNLPVNAPWNISDARIGNHIITVEVEPRNNPDSNLTNNNNTLEEVWIANPWLIYILPVSPPPKEGENVTINVCITNKGPRSVNLSLNFSCLDRYNREIRFDNKSVHIDANSTNYTEASWNARPLFITQDYLFSMGGELETIKDNLNEGTVPGRLKHLFEINAVPLSENNIVKHTFVTTNNTDEWTITDEENNNTYTVREKGGELNVYFPKGITTTRIIKLEAVNARDLDTTTEINIALPNLSITNITLSPPHPAYDDPVNVTVTIKNNENRTVNATLWFYDVNTTIYEIPYKSSKSTFPISYPGALSMGVHFKNLIIETDEEEGKEGYVKVSDKKGNVILKFAPPIASKENPYNYGSVWTKWGYGDNVTINHSRIYGEKEGASRKPALVESVALLNESIVTLNASEGEMNFTLNYNFTQRGIHTLWVMLSNGNKISKTIGGTDLAVSLSLNETVYDGDQVKINATIENPGYVNASKFIVTVFNDSIPLNTMTIPGLSGAQFYPDNITTISIPWNATTWNATAGEQGAHTLNHTIKVEIPREENENIESDESNNCIEKTIQVIPSRDFTVTNITIIPEEQKLETGINISIKAVVWNFGDRTGSTKVNFSISKIDGEKRDFNSTTRPLDPGTNETVSINWTVDLGGNCLINVTVDPDDETRELNETNNSMTKQIYMNASDFVVENLHIDPPSPIEGNTAKINATVENIGDKDAENVTVRFEAKLLESTPDYVWSKNTTILLLKVNDSQNVSMSWDASPAGKHVIKVVADPDGQNPELNETNNETSILAIVQGPDLILSNFSFSWLNGTAIRENDTIAQGENVTITVNVSNIGVLPATGFNVSFIDNCNDNISIIPDTTISIPGLGRNRAIEKSTIWENVSLGDHEIIAVADSDDNIYETNETNNTMERRLMVRGADLVVSDITFTVIPPQGKNASTNATSAIFDTDNVTINATIKNQGVLSAENFTVEMFNGYELEDYNASGEDGSEWVYRELKGASAIYVHLPHIRSGDKVRIYENSDFTEMNNTGWHLVMSDNVTIWLNTGKSEAKLHFYAGDIKYEDVQLLNPNNVTHRYLNVSMCTGDYLCRVVVDTENNATEHNERNNVANRTMHVLPSIDFTVANMRLSLNESEFGVNDTVWDDDTVTVNATVRMCTNESDPHNETREGTTDVDVIDEHGWVNTSPGYELTPHGYCYNISYPGADAIRVHFSELNVSNTGFVEVWNKGGNITITDSSETISPWVDGETIYVCKGGKPSILTPRVIYSIDGYQYRQVNRTTNLKFGANEEKGVNATWNSVSAWDHTIRVITDPDNKTGEINESNNEMNKLLSVTPCKDPAVINITFDPPSPVPRNSKNISVTARIANNGTKTANFPVDLGAYKSERYDYESPHYNDIPQKGFTKTISTYPEADWTAVHFTNITLQEGSDTRRMHVDDKTGNTSDYYHSFNGENIWAWVKGDTLEITIPEYDPNPPWLDGGSGRVWGYSFDEVAHKINLNHTFVTLGPGNTTNVSGILPEMRIGNDSTSYRIYAVVDMDNIVYETDETNNEMNMTLGIAVPDLTVSEIKCEGGKPKAIIENIGFEEAENVTVRFQRDVDKLEPRWEKERREPSSIDSISQEGADIMRVHVYSLNVKEDKNGSLEITNGTFGKIYTEDEYDEWSPWMKVDSVTHSIKLIWNDVNKFRIDKYEYGVDKDLGNFTAGRSEKEDVPEVFTPVNEKYELTVIVDAENEPMGLRGNNEKKKTIGPELTIENITFLDKDGDVVGADKLVINEKYTARVKVRNEKGEINKNEIACVAAEIFKVAFYLNTSDNETIFSDTNTTPRLDPGASRSVPFSLPQLTRGWYEVKAVADENGDVMEFENINIVIIKDVKVAEPGYKAKDGYMPMFEEGEEIHGGVIYDTGNTRRLSESVSSGSNLTTDFNLSDRIPPDAKNIKARLYVYPDWAYYSDEEGHRMAFLPDETQLKVFFNGIEVTDDRKAPISLIPGIDKPYTDIPDATTWNVSYATYCYDVTYEKGIINQAIAERVNYSTAPYKFGIAGMALLVSYVDEDAPLIKYWVAEDRDVMEAKNYKDLTGFEFSECTREVKFDGVTDTHLANATLKTVLVSYVAYDKSQLDSEAGEESDALYFHGRRMDIPLLVGPDDPGTGHWKKVEGGDPKPDIALTKGHDDAKGWEYVDEYIRDGDMTAGIESRGGMMCAAHAILKLTYPPDLVRPDLPKNVVVGKSIPVVIRNTGRSDARNFNVSFYVEGVFKGKTEHVDVKSVDSTTITFPWTPLAVGRTVWLNVSVDSDDDVHELNENNNNASQLVQIVEGPIIPPKHPGGGGGGTGGGWGEGTGTGEGGAGDEGAEAIAGGREGAVGESGGKAITGYLMKGIVATSEEGGGGKGEFSMLALLMRLMMLAAAVVLVCAGYLMERRRQKHKLSLKKKV